MLEVEVKFALGDRKQFLATLAKWGAEIGPSRCDEDRYFNAPDRDFKQTDEALRIRSIGTKNVLTYKGPKIDRETKSRMEIECAIGDGRETAEQFAQLLTSLGYRPTGVVRKSRRIATLTRGGFPLQISLDELDGIGQFAEVETMAEEAQFADAKAAVLDAARELGMTQSERRSYLAMVLEHQGVE